MIKLNTRGAQIASGTAALVAAALLAGCGGGASPLGTAQLTQLRSDIAAARTGVANHDPAAVQAALTTLQSKVESLRQSAALSSDRASALLTEIAQARARVPLDVVPLATPPGAGAPAASAPAPQPDSGAGKDNGNGKDKGKHKGQDKPKDHGPTKDNGDGGN